jgi:anti-anti-sigma factor
MALSIESQEIPGGRLLRIEGQVDLASIADLDSAITALIAARPVRVVLDLSQMTFISSLGIGSIVNLRNALVRHGGSVLVAAPQPMVAEAFRRVRLDDLLAVHDTLESALA